MNAKSTTDPPEAEEFNPHSLTEVFDDLLENTKDGDKASLDDLLSAFGRRSYGPLLLIPSLLALGPTGAIPGMSIAMASLIILIAVQMLFKHGEPWLPERLLKISFPRESLQNGISRSRPYAQWVEKWIKPRIVPLTEQPWSYAVPVVSLGLAALMFPLALVPFGVALPAAALTALSIGLTLKDGYFLLAGYGLGAISLLAVLQLT
jgi:hypothetical protein